MPPVTSSSVHFTVLVAPCIGPILGAILTLSSTSGGMLDGIWLLSIYSAGLGVPFLLAALFTDAIAKCDGEALHALISEASEARSQWRMITRDENARL